MDTNAKVCRVIPQRYGWRLDRNFVDVGGWDKDWIIHLKGVNQFVGCEMVRIRLIGV